MIDHPFFQIYEIHYNSFSSFFQLTQTPDGANAIVVGHLGSLESPIAIVGGNCSIQGFDHKGDEAYWTVSECVCHVY